jgi:hypothetical protein
LVFIFLRCITCDIFLGNISTECALSKKVTMGINIVFINIFKIHWVPKIFLLFYWVRVRCVIILIIKQSRNSWDFPYSRKFSSSIVFFLIVQMSEAITFKLITQHSLKKYILECSVLIFPNKLLSKIQVECMINNYFIYYFEKPWNFKSCLN